jgi:hypothetical protein
MSQETRSVLYNPSSTKTSMLLAPHAREGSLSWRVKTNVSPLSTSAGSASLFILRCRSHKVTTQILFLPLEHKRMHNSFGIATDVVDNAKNSCYTYFRHCKILQIMLDTSSYRVFYLSCRLSSYYSSFVAQNIVLHRHPACCFLQENELMLLSYVQKERVEAMSFSLPASSSMRQILDCIIFPQLYRAHLFSRHIHAREYW